MRDDSTSQESIDVFIKKIVSTIKFTLKGKHKTDTKDPRSFLGTAKSLEGISVLPEDYK